MIPIKKLEDDVFSLTIHHGFDSSQGKREYMEDRIKVIENINKEEDDEGNNIPYFAVFDGHAGCKAADICESSMHEYLLKEEGFITGDMKQALTVSFQKKIIILSVTSFLLTYLL